MAGIDADQIILSHPVRALGPRRGPPAAVVPSEEPESRKAPEIRKNGLDKVPGCA
ncbi:hypothetical protein [Pseudooceanicola batsensis]|uniref:hypothetical protein n=1 Tax=Pseudooceanicola batsensis TaxID=314255 RepID=UPI0012B53FD8|nr:hypothetical protein [Pseudooceanicola batsensis]